MYDRIPWFGTASAMVEGEAAELRLFGGTRKQNLRGTGKN
jgi:hypothetical protein